MADTDDSYKVGFGKPPKNTRFQKGRSGNPKGRPKDSRNLATIVEKIGRERITITENGRSRNITKKEAIVLQLTNKGASGDLKAIREHVHLSVLCENSEQAVIQSVVPHERDQEVMKSILKRIRGSEDLLAEDETGPEPTSSTSEEEE